MHIPVLESRELEVTSRESRWLSLGEASQVLLLPQLEQWIVLGASGFLCLLVIIAMFTLCLRRRDRKEGKPHASFYYWTTLAVAGVVFVAAISATIWKWVTSESVPALELISSLSQAALWLLVAVSIFLERIVVVEVHNPVLRLVWISNFLVCISSFGSALIRAESVLHIKSGVNYPVLAITSLGSLFLLVAACVGKNGLAPSSSSLNGEQIGHLTAPLLGNGFTEYGGESSEKGPGYTKYDGAGVISTLCFFWLNPLLKDGRQRVLGLEDIPRLGKGNDVDASYALFKAQWDKADQGKNKSLPVILILAHWPKFVITGALGVLKLCVMFVGPLLLQSFVDLRNDQNSQWYNGVGLVLLLLLAKMVEVVCDHQSNIVSRKISVGIWAGLVSATYRKGLKITSSARQTHGTGKIVNYMSVDAKDVAETCQTLHDLWQMPIQIIIAMVILYAELGIATLSGIGAMVMFLVGCLVMALKQQTYYVNIMAAKDERMKVTNEALASMKIIKLYAWIEKFLAKIEAAREVERGWLTKIMYLAALNICFLWLSPIVVSVVAFGTCILLGIPLTPGTVFTAIATFRIVQEPLRTFPQMVMQAVQALVSIRRIRTYLDSAELDIDAVLRVPPGAAPYAVEVQDGNFKWDSAAENLTLKDINVQVPRGTFTAIVGTVGSGKSCLLSCILGEMETAKGQVVVSGTVAYVPQTAWIQNGTIKDNILFGKPLDEALYKETLQMCALEGDLKQMIHGDQTEIGERGINLSGGQKQRVQLARALYQDADIYLLDDIFSALDAHTGSSIFKECVSKALGSKTVLLVTHQVEFLHNADLILVMRDGSIVQSGKYGELLDEGTDFGALVEAHTENLQSHEGVQDGDDNGDVVLALGENVFPSSIGHVDILLPSSIPTLVAMSVSPKSGSYLGTSPVGSYGTHFQGRELDSQDSGKFREIGRSSSKKALLRKSSSRAFQSAPPAASAIASNKLIEEEEREKGRVGGDVYWAFVTKTLYGTHVIALLLIQTSWQGLQIGGDFWLANATSVPAEEFRPSHFIYIYAGLAFGSGLFVLCRAFLVSFAALRTGQRFFLDMLRSIFRAPMSFFDTTPIGRVLTRSSTDQVDIDVFIPFVYGTILALGFQTLGVLFVMSDVTPQMLFLIVPLLFVFVWYQNYFISTARELTRLEAVTEAPIIQHFSETISGFVTVRAFGHQERFVSTNVKLVNDNATIQFHNSAVCEWLGTRLESMGNFILCMSALALVLSPRNWVRPEFVGLSLSYGLALNSCLFWLVWTVSQLEQKMVAVERILQYTKLPSEAPLVIEGHRPEPNWPTRGSVAVRNLHLRYRQDTPLVLKGVTFSLRGGEKMGVVGRTGSGKTSLIQALFRIVEPAEGRIVVDGIDISTIGLGDLRSRFSIIPQEPTLFEGTVRNNVDPLEEYSDVQIWDALEKCQLADIVREKEKKLDFPVTENGENWSMGQRQLFCLGRALLRRSKVLILDEATASVDSQTDNILQKTITKEYAQATIISIAHRIPSVMDSDKVLVLEAGLVKEFAAPSTLLEQPSSMFSALVQEYWNRSDSVQDLKKADENHGS